jgi:iron complex outermembrane receptor protein
VTVTAEAASTSAPSQAILTARSAQSVVSREFIENSTSPAADYSQVMLAVPGMFSYSSNGPGMSDTKTFFRGFKDGQYNIMFDGIPFYDTNDPTHHSWTFFPTQFLGGAVVDRSPGSAASIGPTTFGGSVNLQSRNLGSDPHVVGTMSYGSFGTKLLGAEYESGGTSQKFIANVTDSRSDGYQTYNRLDRDSVSGKYTFAPSPATQFTLFSGYVRMVSNTPDWKDPLRSDIATFGDNYLMNSDPTSSEYYGYEHYHVTTDFSYFGVKHDLGRGWSVDNKTYLYAYHNHENVNAQTGAITATSGVDKLNAYRTLGNILPVTQTSHFGVLRTGLWSQYSWTDRHQTPEDPRTGPNFVQATLPNFHETFNTLSLQPYAEYEYHPLANLKVTPGIKYSAYSQDFVQFADNGKTVGSLNGQPSISHQATYDTWLPSLDGHYLVSGSLSVYAQYARGDAIPPTKVFDQKNAAVGTLPKPTIAATYQTGTVFQAGRMNLGFDVFHTHFENTYSAVLNKETNETDFFASGASIAKGAEAEVNVVAGGGLSVYVNASALRARFADTGLLVANSPTHTEAVGLTYGRGQFSANAFVRHAGSMFNDNGSVHEAIPIDSVALTNVSATYHLRNQRPRDFKIQVSVSNLFNNRNIIAISPASKASNLPSPGDSVTLLAGRSAALTFTIDFARR